MDNRQYRDVGRVVDVGGRSLIATNSVLKNTYLLLALSLLFSAFTAELAILGQVAPISPLFFLIVTIGLQFLISATANRAMGLLSVFLFTGFIGFYTGPIINLFIHAFSNGSELVLTALGGTGMIFLGLSSYVLITRRDMTFLSGTIVIGSIVAIVAMLAGLLFHLTVLQLAVSGMFIVLSSCYILWETSNIINGGQNNYILATVTLYLSIFNLFMSLLSILGFMSGSRD